VPTSTVVDRTFVLVDQSFQLCLSETDIPFLSLICSRFASLHRDETGPVVVVLVPSPVPDTSALVAFEGTIQDSDIVDTTCGATVEDLLASFVAGGAHVNVHSAENAAGEARGQIDTLVVFWPSLTGGAEVPAVTTTVSGTATFSLNPSSSAIDYSLDLTNPDAIGLFGGPGAHIHCGGPYVLLVLDDVIGT